MTSPQAQQPNGRDGDQEQWVPPPLQPLEVAAVASVFVLLAAIVFAREFDPAPREAVRNVHVSLLLLTAAVPTVFLNWRAMRSDLFGAAPLAASVLYLLLSVWLGIVEPHRVIPWYLHPLTVCVALCAGGIIGRIVRARNRWAVRL